MIPSGALASHFAPAFTELQSAIEAIDRAIADEARLPEALSEAEPAPQDFAENVERVDFHGINNPDG